MAWPLPSVIPEAVRNSVSMRSEITGARAGITDRNSSSLALCQVPAKATWALPASTSHSSAIQRTLVKMHDSPLQGSGGRLGAIGDAQFAQQAVDMGLHRSLGNVERGRDLFVAVAAHNQLQDFGFAGGERGRAHALREALGHRSRYARLAGIDRADGVHEFFPGHAFQQVAAGARLQRTVDVFIPIEGGEHDN